MSNHKEKETLSDSIDRARDHFNAGWKELADAATDAKERGQDVWTEAQKKGRDAWVNAKAKGMESWEDLKERGNEAWSDTRVRGEEMVQDAEKLVRKYPTRAIGLVLLVGVFVGALISRDRD